MNRHFKTHGPSALSALHSHKDEYRVKFEEKPEYATPSISEEIAQHMSLNETTTIKKWIPSSLCAGGMRNAGRLRSAIVDDGSVGGDSEESVMSDGDDSEDDEDDDTIKLLNPYLPSREASLLLPVSAMRSGLQDAGYDERGSRAAGEFPYGRDVRFALLSSWCEYLLTAGDSSMDVFLVLPYPRPCPFWSPHLSLSLALVNE
jgi:hypothetical protein